MRQKWNIPAVGGMLLIAAAMVRAPIQKIAERRGPHLTQTAVPEPLQQQVREHFRRLPLTFVRNEGQIDPAIRFYARRKGFAAYFSPHEAMFGFRTALPRSTRWRPVGGSGATRLYRQTEPGLEGAALAMQFPGASPRVSMAGRRNEPGRVNCFAGKDPPHWRTGLTAYREVVYRGLWPGVDLVFRGAADQMDCELDLRPGARLDQIRLAYYGSHDAGVDPAGNLHLRAAFEALTLQRPQLYEVIDGARVPLAGHFLLQHSPDGAATVGFQIDHGYRRRHALVLTLHLVATSPMEGTDGSDVIDSVAVDGQGAAYVTGTTLSVGLPPHSGAFELPYEDGIDAFVAKLDGTVLRYATYLGGSGADAGRLLAVDRSGSVHLVGTTRSRDFPTTADAYDRTHNGGWDLFIVKLGAGGAELLGATYLGSGGMDVAWSLTLDPAGNVYIAGKMGSPDFPATGQFADTEGGDFRAKLDSRGTHLLSCQAEAAP
jgi:Beta-propeller repeat